MTEHYDLSKTLSSAALVASLPVSSASFAQLGVLLGMLLLGTGCGAAAPTPELTEARSAYAAAKAGPAAELAPARLEEARQALEKAEAAFEKDWKSEETKVAAYIATRRAEIAAVRGKEKDYRRELKKLKEEYDELEKKRLTMTQEQLNTVKVGLAQTTKALDEAQKARSAAEMRLSSAVASLKELAQVKEESRGVVITLSGSVLFSTGKYKLLPIAEDKLDEVAKALKDQGYRRIIVEGHTDSQGSESNNEALSLSRAEAVRDHLISQGIERDLVQAKGLGESRPVASNDTPDGRANNRRVEIVVE